ncbi:GNAT family N-acetyltransferase [Gloeocapsopsis dulcis]|uniref:GNAT family N-acetyltransferase n=1 Tax=Gloeocapsopsis dulcis AAB1 = 1H9 TaxID=1433147 RepID=A0A6N8G1A6_9CHRO|nr:GNAT family N-acetyltransferase [Gloeocapsopsis dulcis]MUL39190.1 GNAT family N-acetyltransferase [Gloeocapsopsis dulcis AAB1 = 1H9]WNN90768.1 GNAT family N-acetyltransferase [Gloeocapsopsis dulcis]
MDSDYLIEPLSSHHDRAAFCCGVEALDRYLQKQASQDARKYIAAPYVLFDKNSNVVIGYYTLCGTNIIAEELPTEIAKKLPRYPMVPATLLGRLAVDKNYRGKRLGEDLLMDALYRSFLHAKNVASMAVVVDAKDNKARSFYEHYDFIRFPDQPNRLFLPMFTIVKMFE